MQKHIPGVKKAPEQKKSAVKAARVNPPLKRPNQPAKNGGVRKAKSSLQTVSKKASPSSRKEARSTAMSKQKKPHVFNVRPVTPGEVAAIILRDLTRNHSDVCNFTPEAALAQKGEIFLAYIALQEKCAGIGDHSPRHVWVKAQALASLKKVSDPAYDRWPSARSAWFSAEHRCKRTNQKLAAWQSRHLKGEKPLPFKKEITRMREFIAYVVGPEPAIERILLGAHHGPGSTVQVSGAAVHLHKKLGAFDATSLAVELAAAALVHDKSVWTELGLDPIYSHLESAREGFHRVACAAIRDQLVSHDKLLFIHKGITSLRSIGAQPTLNCYVQLGADDELKRLLLDRANVDLADQSRNQRLALIGSLHHDDANPICTLDKTDASNLIANRLVIFSFPSGWSKFLQRTRTPGYTAPKEFGGGQYVYEKYAGMGNGTTFSVETLLFAGIAFAVSGQKIEEFISDETFAVYGDDVIMNRKAALKYIRFAEYLGLIISKEKSFLTGKFRESCGADYWEGVNVRPAYVKCESSGMHELELIGVHNTLVDHPSWKLLEAAREIRSLFRQRVNKTLPTDPQGGLGFRPTDESGGYDIVRDKAGKPALSTWWQRPRFYVYDVRAKLDYIDRVGPWVQLAIALSKGQQVWTNQGGSTWTLPYRNLINIRLKAEEDMPRRTLIQMVSNQLSQLSARKKSAWWNPSRGL